MIKLSPAKALSTLAGPLGSFRNFVSMLALDNCVDYFNEFQRLEEQGGDSTRRRLTRLLFNAVVALDSAADHLCMEHDPTVPVNEFVEELAKTEPALLVIRDLANAMKHCKRGRVKKGSFTGLTGKPDAKDILEAGIEGEVMFVEDDTGVRPEVVNIKITAEFLDGAHEAVEKAFRYWIRYVQ